jgi:negative regulator of flagellin synthesis FlgM
MRITNGQVEHILGAYLNRVQKSAEKSASERPAPQDRVSLSSRAADIDAARSRISDLPEVRADRVEHLRRMIARGDYNVSAVDIADAILSQARAARAEHD